MKRMHIVLCVGLLLTGPLFAQKLPAALGQQQKSKPLLFAKLPEQFSCSATELQKLLNADVNESVQVQLSDQFFIRGKIISRKQNVPGTITTNIRLENYNNALFNLTLRLTASNAHNLRGRILHPRHGDVLILSADKNGYHFKKTSQRLFMTD